MAERRKARYRIAASRRISDGVPRSASEYAVDLARHDEIVLVQSFDLLGAQGADRVTPAEADVRVMAFGLGKLTEFLNKGERFPEIAELKGPLDAMGIVTQLPIGSLYLEVLGFITREWRDAAATGRACLLGALVERTDVGRERRDIALAEIGEELRRML